MKTFLLLGAIVALACSCLGSEEEQIVSAVERAQNDDEGLSSNGVRGFDEQLPATPISTRSNSAFQPVQRRQIISPSGEPRAPVYSWGGIRPQSPAAVEALEAVIAERELLGTGVPLRDASKKELKVLAREVLKRAANKKNAETSCIVC